MNAPQNIAMEIDTSSHGEDTELAVDSAVDSTGHGPMARIFGHLSVVEKLNRFYNSIIALFVLLFACTFIEDYVPALVGWGRPTAFFAALIGLVWVGFAKRATRLDIVEPIANVAGEMRRLSEGARDIEVSGLNRKDELGDLARSLDAFSRDYVRMDKMLLESEAHDQVREDAAADRQRELVRIAEEFETSIGEIAGSVASAATQLSATAADMAKTAHGSSETAQSVADAMKRASDVATAAAAASDEFALSIDEISRQAMQSEQFARDAATSADGTDANISALSESAEEISEVLELIQTIANRTNLLALNASIEAARGGDSGRGFAVVASEVKELAHQTSAATSKVGSQIETMQGSTRASVEQLRNVAKHIHDLERTSVSIASAVDQQSVAGKELARNIDVSARETGEVASYAKDLLAKATGVGSAADQLLDSSKELDMQAGKLTAQAEMFLKRIRQN